MLMHCIPSVIGVLLGMAISAGRFYPILFGVIGSVIGWGVLMALQPSDFCITRTVMISAPAEAVFAQVNDFHNWQAWSPLVPPYQAGACTFGGAPAGTGAIFTWPGSWKMQFFPSRFLGFWPEPMRSRGPENRGKTL